MQPISSVPDWTITTLNTSTFVAVELPDETCAGSIAIYTSDGSGVYFAKDAAGLDVRPWHPDNKGEMWSGVKAADGSKTVMYAKAMTGATDLVLLYQKR